MCGGVRCDGHRCGTVWWASPMCWPCSTCLGRLVRMHPRCPPSMTDSTYAIVVDTAIVYAQGLSHEALNSDASTTMAAAAGCLCAAGGRGRTGPPSSSSTAVDSRADPGVVGGPSPKRNTSPAEVGWRFPLITACSLTSARCRKSGLTPVFSAGSDSVGLGQLAQGIAIYPAHRDAKAAMRWVAAARRGLFHQHGLPDRGVEAPLAPSPPLGSA